MALILSRDVPQDVEEVVNYVRAMNYGLERLATLPLSLRLIREIHAELLSGARGADKLPGEFRRSQNWIGPGGALLSQATFLPPPVPEMTEALHDLEKFLHAGDDLPVLVHCGLVHAPFEAIHPGDRRRAERSALLGRPADRYSDSTSYRITNSALCVALTAISCMSTVPLPPPGWASEAEFG